MEDDVKESIKAVEEKVDAVSDRIDGAVSDRIQSVEQKVNLNSDLIADKSSVGGVTLGEANEIVVPAAGGVVTIQGQFENSVLNGFGRVIFEDKEYYIGFFKN